MNRKKQKAGEEVGKRIAENLKRTRVLSAKNTQIQGLYAANIEGC